MYGYGYGNEKSERSSGSQQEKKASESQSHTHATHLTPQNPLSAVRKDLKPLQSKNPSVQNGPITMQQQDVENRYQFLVSEKEKMKQELRKKDEQIEVLKQEKHGVDVEKSSLSRKLEFVRSERDEANQTIKRYESMEMNLQMAERQLIPQHNSHQISTQIVGSSDRLDGTQRQRHEIELKDEDLQQRYERGDWVGKGTFGVVFKAKDKKTGDAVAMKIMKLAEMRHFMRNLKIDRRELMRKVKTEKEVMKQCSHKNIIKFMNYFQNGPTELNIVMEFCYGGNLGDHMFSNGPLEEDTAQRFSRQIRDALLYLRSLEITHRDLKPANILLTENSASATLKLSDFGESAFKVYDENGITAHQTLAGTGYYMAPEVLAKRDSTLHHKYRSDVDLWSFGVIIYEMITNTLPYQKESGKSLLQVMLTKKITVKDVNNGDDGKELLLGLLKTNNEDRTWDIVDPQKPNCNKWLQEPSPVVETPTVEALREELQIAQSRIMDLEAQQQETQRCYKSLLTEKESLEQELCDKGRETRTLLELIKKQKCGKVARVSSLIKEEEFANDRMPKLWDGIMHNLHDDIVEELSDIYEDLEDDEDNDFNDDSKENGNGAVKTKPKFELLMDRVASEFLFGVLVESMKAMKERKSKIRQINLPDIVNVVDGVYNVVINKKSYSSWKFLWFLNGNKLKKYIKECFEICWMMILTEPELSFYPTSFRAIYDDKKEDHRYDEKEQHDLWQGSKTESGAKIIYFTVPAISLGYLVDKDKSLQVLPGQLFVHNDENVVKYIMSDPDELMDNLLTDIE